MTSISPFQVRSGMQQIVLYLGECPAFSGLNETQLTVIAKLFKFRQFLARQVILHSGESSADVYFIAAGSVRTTMVSPVGKEIFYQDLGVGEMFGEMSAIDNLPRTTDVITIEDTGALVISKVDFNSLLDQYPIVSKFTIQKIARMVRFLCDRVYQYGALDVSTRVRAELVRLAETQGQKINNQILINKMPTHQELANRLATHREAVTRELSALDKEGVVKKTKQTFTILDINFLKAASSNN